MALDRTDITPVDESSPGAEDGTALNAAFFDAVYDEVDASQAALKLDDLATPDDNTDLNVSTSRHGLTPKITGSDGHVLTKSGTGAVWSAPGASVAGSDTQVQFNDGGALAGDSGLTFNRTSNVLRATGGFSIDGTSTLSDFTEWTNVAFSAGNFTASSGNWTLASGDQVTLAYRIVGKTMHVKFVFITTTVSATPAALRFAIPASKVAARDVLEPNMLYNDNNGPNAIGMVSITAGGTTIGLVPITGLWSTSTNLTYVFGEVEFEIQ